VLVSALALFAFLTTTYIKKHLKAEPGKRALLIPKPWAKTVSAQCQRTGRLRQGGAYVSNQRHPPSDLKRAVEGCEAVAPEGRSDQVSTEAILK
jgi:hypothetical protein